MTLPHERENAVRNARRFLVSLMDPSSTPRVPRYIRTEARSLLKHYPWDGEADLFAGKRRPVSSPKSRRNNKERT